MSRIWIFVIVAACSSSPAASLDGGAAGTCPTMEGGDGGDSVLGTACDLPADTLCFVLDEFSSCRSTTYRCVDHAFVIDHELDPVDGASCIGAELQSCSQEGNPSCDTEPTSQSCTCVDGRWQCWCACWGGGDCNACPAVFDASLTGEVCATPGATCDFPGHTCTCVADGSADPYGTFSCD